MLRLQHVLLIVPVVACIFLIGLLFTHDGNELRSRLPIRGQLELRLESRLRALERLGLEHHAEALQSSDNSTTFADGLLEQINRLLERAKEYEEELSATMNETLSSVRADNKELLAQLAAMRERLNELTPQKNAPTSESSRSPPVESTRKGLLLCNGEQLDSEVIYWKVVPGDLEYESPITPHHHEHEEKFITFNFDNAGFNNMRMTVECLIVAAHAMGRTLVFPPNLDHAGLLRFAYDNHQMGFEELISMKQLQSQKGFHSMSMEEFLRNQGLTGKLKGIYPPKNNTLIHGDMLKDYLVRIADHIPYENTTWLVRFLVFPDSIGDFRMKNYLDHMPSDGDKRLFLFYGRDENGRAPIFYDTNLRAAKVIHIVNDVYSFTTRALQHHYAFTFFADPDMASFYKRFIRDFVRYDDPIFCHAARLVAAIREESLKLNPENNGDFYAMHIRRGDIHIRQVKVSAKQMLEELRFPDNSSIIPRGAYVEDCNVYIATDDPDGVCRGCVSSPRVLCPVFNASDPSLVLPEGCLSAADSSWDAFIEAGWHIRFLRDFVAKGLLQGANQHMHALIETVICSRAKRFSGTLYSTFSGYIHRLRGYHGLGEESYLHAPLGAAMYLRDPRSVGSGWAREWRAGWTDDEGGLI